MNHNHPITGAQTPIPNETPCANTRHTTGISQRVEILGVAIDAITEAEALDQIKVWLQKGGPHHIVTVNPEFVMEARRNPNFGDVLRRADLATADGFGIILAARWQGTPLPGRITGVNLTHRLAELAAAYGYRLFLLGAAPGIAERAAAVLTERYPGLIIAGCHAGSPNPRYEPFIRQIITAAQPDILLVAYGHPAQDVWIDRNQPWLRIPVAIGVGGTFDYISGSIPRAPTWLRRAGLEWLFRVIYQPRRWRRIYTAVLHFTWTMLREGKRTIRD